MLALNLVPVYWLIFSPNYCPVCLPMVLFSDSLIDKGLVTVIKSKTGRTKSNDNYRPTPLASVAGKVAEIVIYIIVSLFILILVRTSLDLKETTSLINVYVYLKRLSALIVFSMVVSSLVF